MTTETHDLLLLTKTGFTQPRDGGALRVSALVRELTAQAGMVVHPVAVENADEGATRRAADSRLSAVAVIVANIRVIARFLRIGSLSAARWYRPRVVRELIALQRTARPAIRLIEYSQLLGYRPILTGPVVLDMHNVEHELMRNYSSSAGPLKAVVARWESWRLRALEAKVGRQTDLVAVVSEHDEAVLRTIATGEPPRVVVAPNGVADAGFELELGGHAKEVTFIGHLGWAPNVEGAEWLVRAVWPIVHATEPSAHLSLVGRSPSRRVWALANESVTVHADVESVLPFLSRSSVATAPLLAAGGTRLKILEALSTGTPVVATSLGALGLDHIGEPALAIADDPADFADRILRMLSSDCSPSTIRRQAEPYRWGRAFRPLVDALVAMTAAH